MKTTSALLLLSAVALSACANANRFDDMAPGGAAAGAGTGNGVTSTPLAPAQDPRSATYFQQTVGDRVLFTVDSSEVTVTGRATLEGQARWLMQNPDYLAVIEGHADETGTREYNLALGARRANAVRDFLIARGVAPGRIRTVSYGKERPIEVCSVESCYAQNRRAVTVITSGAVS